MSRSKSAGIAALLVAAIAGAAVVWYLNDDGPVSVVGEIEARTSRALGTRVDITESDVDWSEGRVSLSGIAVANPGGFSDSDMVTAEAVEIRGDLADRSVQSIDFRGVTAAIEFRGSNSNFESLSDRIEDASEKASEPGGDGEPAGAGEKAAAASQSGDGGEGRVGDEDDEWKVARVAFGPIKVSVRADWTDKTVSLETGGFSVEGLGGDGDRLARAATVEFLAGVLEQAAEQAGDDRLRELLLDKAAEVRERMPSAE